MTQLTLAEAKTHFLEIIRKALLGEEIVIADEDRPLVKIVPLSASGERKPGSGAGQLLYMADDFDAPLDDFEEYQ
ncbi:MAG: type II toxin-antitoxin system Phd/YefM family antitoxin [Candidatus Electrothrix sp. MAN1_4]|nr:type II toxin-antitoxin system Phd/YefM family antitoxin [Candidatus Electrothrix sp. MAN1_4]